MGAGTLVGARNDIKELGKLGLDGYELDLFWFPYRTFVVFNLFSTTM